MQGIHLAIVFYIAYGYTMVLAFPVDMRNPSNAFSSHALQNSEACKVLGNPDLYGLGIRLGVYTQLISSLLANYYHDEILQDAWDTNTIFLVAVFVGTLRETVVGDLQSVEAFIMLLMIFAFLLSVFEVSKSFTWSIIEYVQREFISDLPAEFLKLMAAHNKFSDLGALTRTCLRMAVSSYNIWFWFRGINKLQHTDYCVPVSFLFIPTDLDNRRVLAFYRTIAVLYLYFTSIPFELIRKGVFMVRHVNMRHGQKRGPRKITWVGLRYQIKRKCSDIWRNYITMGLSHEVLNSKKSSKEKKRSHANEQHKRKRQLGYFRLCMASCSLAIILWSMVTIELTISWSNISGVNGILSVGQLIPTIIGVSGLLRTIHSIIIRWADKKRQAAKRRLSGATMDPKTGIWQFCLGDGRTARFQNSYPLRRRWSFEAPPTKNDKRQPAPASFFRDTLDDPPPASVLVPLSILQATPRIDSQSFYSGLGSSNISSRSNSLASTVSFRDEARFHYPHRRYRKQQQSRIQKFKTLIGEIFWRFQNQKQVRKCHSGEWRYPLRNGRIQVFGDFHVRVGRSSFDNAATRILPFSPHMIDAPDPLRDVKEKSQEMRNRRKLDRQEALCIQKRRRERSPGYQLQEAQWRYRLRNGCTQVFYCNTTTSPYPSHRRWSCNDAKGFDVERHLPYAFREALESPAAAGRHRMQGKKVLRLHIVEWAFIVIVLPLLLLCKPLSGLFFSPARDDDDPTGAGDAARLRGQTTSRE